MLRELLVLLIAVSLMQAPRSASAQPVITFPGGHALAAYGDTLLTSDVDAKEVRRFDWQTGALLRTFATPSPDDDAFGTSLATLGDDVVIGAPAHAPDGGSVYIFDVATGSLVRTLTRGPMANDLFGWSVAVVGGNVLVGAPGDSTADSFAGAAYLFDGADGTLLRTFLSPTPTPGPPAFFHHEGFGAAVAAVGGNVLVGTPREQRAYLFDTATGALLQTFAPPSPSGTAFGRSVAGLGDDVLVSAPGYNNPTPGTVHHFDGASGALVRTLQPSPAYIFGALAVEGDALLVGGDASYAGIGGVMYLYDGPSGTLLRTYERPRAADVDLGGAVGFVMGKPVVGQSTNSFEGGRSAHLFCGGIVGCGPCETCAPGGGCVAAPSPTCRRGNPDRRPEFWPRLKIRRASQASRDQVRWFGLLAITKGDAFLPGDFADPLTRQDYTLCLYDESGPTPSIIFRATAPAGGECGPRSCWKRAFPANANYGWYRGFAYRDTEETPEGAARITLETEIDDLTFQNGGSLKESRISFRASGENLSNRPLGLPALPLPLPVRVQLQATDGMCWEGRYSVEGVLRNTSAFFDARPD